MRAGAAVARETRTALAGADACPVCRSPGPQPFLSAGERDYWRCVTCAARFLDQRQLPSRDAEYAHYLRHENHPDDPGYRRFLSKLTVPLLARLPPASRPVKETGLYYLYNPVSDSLL
jgi:hypothetical protein